MARVRIIVHKTWLVHNPPAELAAAIERAIQTYGMSATRVGDRLELRGGSSFKVKALGPRLTAASDLPRVGTIECTAGSEGSGTARVTVHLEDRLNSARLDPATQRKYERVFGSIAASVEATLSESAQDAGVGATTAEESGEAPDRSQSPIVEAAGWWTDVSLGVVVKRCHVADAKWRDIGALMATEAGIAFTGNPKGGCRWEDLADLEIIEFRDGPGGRKVRRFVLMTSRDGQRGEFQIIGAEPKPVYAIHELLHAPR